MKLNTINRSINRVGSGIRVYNVKRGSAKELTIYAAQVVMDSYLDNLYVLKEEVRNCFYLKFGVENDYYN